MVFDGRMNLCTYAIALVVITLVSTGAFNSHIPRIDQDLNILSPPKQSSNLHINYGRRNRVRLNGWLEDAFTSLGLDFALEKLRFKSNVPSSLDNDSDPKEKYGTVIRTAVKAYNKEGNQPSSKLYTTKKESRAEIILGPDGVKGDYNHYRTIALSSTPNRAVSILTTDILKTLKEVWKQVGEGDLGENIYIDGIDYTFFEVGKRYTFQTKNTDNDNGGDNKGLEEGVVVGKFHFGPLQLVFSFDMPISTTKYYFFLLSLPPVEITERIEPCGNLCKLPYINNESIPPKERFEQCKKFLLWLDEKEGLRGWYGKIIGAGGRVKIGDSVTLVAATS